MTPPLICAGLEVTLNRYLQLEPAALQDCAALSGQSIAIEVSGLDWLLFIEFDARGVRVLGEAPRPASVSVRGPLPALAQLAWKSGRGDNTLPRDLLVEGDAELLHRFRRMLGKVGLDLEEWAAPLLGDGAAHRLAQGLKTLFGWSRRSADTLAQNTAEYLREETRDLARASDVADWMTEVDLLRERVDRLEARLAQLERTR